MKKRIPWSLLISELIHNYRGIPLAISLLLLTYFTHRLYYQYYSMASGTTITGVVIDTDSRPRIPRENTSGTSRRFVTVKIDKDRLVRVEIPYDSFIKNGANVKLHHIHTKLFGLERYVFLEEQNFAQQSGPAEATAGENSPLPPR